MATARELREYAATVLVQKWLNLRLQLGAKSEEDVERLLPTQTDWKLELFLSSPQSEGAIRDYFQHAQAWQLQVQPYIRNLETVPAGERDALVSAFKITQQRTALIVSRGWHFPAITWRDVAAAATPTVAIGGGLLLLLIVALLILRK